MSLCFKKKHSSQKQRIFVHTHALEFCHRHHVKQKRTDAFIVHYSRCDAAKAHDKQYRQ